MSIRLIVLKTIQENPGKTGDEIADIAGIHWKQVSGPLRYLRAAGKIVKHGSSYKTVYFPV